MINNNRLKGIQLLRAIAVLMVVHCHVLDLQPSHTKSGNSFQHHFFYLPDFGAAGVDIFFVISGFIITVISATYAHNNKAVDFFKKRLIRVIPLYWLVSLIFILLLLMNGRTVNTDRAITSFVIFPFFSNPSLDIPVLIQGWTLSFELLFYMVVSAAMMMNRQWYVLIVVLFFLTCIIFNYHFAGTTRNTFIRFIGNGIMLEFLMGAIAGIVFLRLVSVKPVVANMVLFAGAGGLLISLFTGYGSVSEAAKVVSGALSYQRALIWGLPSALLVAGVALKEKTRILFVHPFWVAIGNASFSIYLTHLFFLPSLYARNWFKHSVVNVIHPDLLLFISLAFAVAVGCIFYRLVELPLLRRLSIYIEKPANRVRTTEMQ
jgi:exopolysaccharide production protein ExoZ